MLLISYSSVLAAAAAAIGFNPKSINQPTNQPINESIKSSIKAEAHHRPDSSSGWV
jgi:hypothetical protein